MIVIVDNGESYSDHEIMFVDCTPDEAEQIKRRFLEITEVKRRRWNDRWGPEILGTSEAVTWLADVKRLSFSAFMASYVANPWFLRGSE